MPIPSPDRPLRLGTRQSPLAMAQAYEARRLLASAHALAEDSIEIVRVRATGDKVQDRPLAEIGGKALWTKELDLALLAGEIDFAVHSAKDVETVRPPEIAIAAVLEREDVRDVLIGAASISALKPGAVVGTSAPRRAAQLLNARPDCSVVPIRGNVATRLAKVATGEVDATFLAAAGLNRLGQRGTGRPLDPVDWLPAPAQAAIAIECRADDTRTHALLGAIDHWRSHRAVLAERALLAALGGNCHSPIAVLCELEDAGSIRMRATIFSPTGAHRRDGLAAVNDAADAAQLARQLLDGAPEAIRENFSGAAA